MEVCHLLLRSGRVGWVSVHGVFHVVEPLSHMCHARCEHWVILFAFVFQNGGSECQTMKQMYKKHLEVLSTLDFFCLVGLGEGGAGGLVASGIRRVAKSES